MLRQMYETNTHMLLVQARRLASVLQAPIILTVGRLREIALAVFLLWDHFLELVEQRYETNIPMQLVQARLAVLVQQVQMLFGVRLLHGQYALTYRDKHALSTSS